MRPLLFIALPLVLSGCFQQRKGDVRSTTPAHGDLSSLLACHDKSVGGPALRGIAEVNYVLDITEPGFTVLGRYRASRSGEVRIDIFADEERVFSEGWNGTSGWQLPGGATDTVPTSQDGAAALRHGLEQPGHLWTLADMLHNGHRLEWAEPDEADGEGSQVLRLTLADGFETWYWVDPQTCLITRSRNFRAYHPDVDPARKWTETVFTDFRTQDGITRAWRTLNIDVVTGDTIGRTQIREMRESAGRDERPSQPGQGSGGARDLAAIEALHQSDMSAVPAGDVDALMALWSSDPIGMPPEGPLLKGRDDIRAMLEGGRRRADSPWDLVEYSQDFTEVEVLGDYGWDLGTVTTRLIHRTNGTEVVVNGKLLRILKRESDGRWTVHRSMWSQEAPVVHEPEGH